MEIQVTDTGLEKIRELEDAAVAYMHVTGIPGKEEREAVLEK